MRSCNGLPIVIITATVVFFTMKIIRRNPPKVEIPSYFQKSRKCLMNEFINMKTNEIWEIFSKGVSNCSIENELRLSTYVNRDDTKYFAKPARYRDNPFIKECTVVSLGVGEDIVAEELLQHDFPHCQFIGADPIKEKNEELFNQIGSFHSVAVGGQNGVIEADVFENGSYQKKNVTAIDLSTFLTKNVERKVIDSLWIDTEYAEYDTLAQLLKTARAYEEGYRICQFNIEVHGHLDKNEYLVKFGKFIKVMLEEGIFIPVHSMQNVHIVAYFLNIADNVCVERFVEKKSK